MPTCVKNGLGDAADHPSGTIHSISASDRKRFVYAPQSSADSDQFDCCIVHHFKEGQRCIQAHMGLPDPDVSGIRRRVVSAFQPSDVHAQIQKDAG